MVYSFCMCLGGKVVVVVLELGWLVINGMSEYVWDEVNVNSVIVVGIILEVDYLDYFLVGIVL